MKPQFSIGEQIIVLDENGHVMEGEIYAITGVYYLNDAFFYTLEDVEEGVFPEFLLRAYNEYDLTLFDTPHTNVHGRGDAPVQTVTSLTEVMQRGLYALKEQHTHATMDDLLDTYSTLRSLYEVTGDTLYDEQATRLMNDLHANTCDYPSHYLYHYLKLED